MVKILLLANASSALLRSWARVAGRDHQIFLVSIKEKDESLTGIHFRRVHVKNSVIRSYLRLFFRIKSIVKEIKPDIILSHYTLNYGFIASHSKFRPHLVVVYGSDVFRRFFFRKLINRLVFRSADRLFVSTENTKHFLREEYHLPKEKIVTRPWGINTQLFSPEVRLSKSFRSELFHELNIDPSDAFLLSPRLIGSVYNHEIILEAFALISKRHPEYKLIMMHYNLAATDRYYLRLKQLSERLQIADKIIWVGRYLTSEEMADIFSLAELMINIPKHDQLALSLLEGLSCGCFCIVSDLPPYHEIVKNGHNGFILPTLTPEAVSQAFEKYFQQKDVYQKNALMSGREIVEKYREEDFISFIRKEVTFLVRTYDEQKNK